MEHYSSCLVLDEDVWEEIQFWMKSLVNMWREDDEDQDCVFFENARDIHEQKHMSIECEFLFFWKGGGSLLLFGEGEFFWKGGGREFGIIRGGQARNSAVLIPKNGGFSF